MADIYLNSNKVKIYPSANRGKNTNNDANILYDPEARVNTEENITRVSENLSDRVISGPSDYDVTSNNDGFVEFFLAGYYFKINIKEIFKNYISQSVYACIKTKQITVSPSSAAGFESRVIANIKDENEYVLDQSNEFQGLKLIIDTSIPSVGDDEHLLKLGVINENQKWKTEETWFTLKNLSINNEATIYSNGDADFKTIKNTGLTVNGLATVNNFNVQLSGENDGVHLQKEQNNSYTDIAYWKCTMNDGSVDKVNFYTNGDVEAAGNISSGTATISGTATVNKLVVKDNDTATVDSSGNAKFKGNIETTNGDIKLSNNHKIIYNSKNFTFPSSNGEFVTDNSIVGVLTNKNVTVNNLIATGTLDVSGNIDIGNENTTTNINDFVTIHKETINNITHKYVDVDGRIKINSSGFDPSIILHGYENSGDGNVRIHLYPSSREGEGAYKTGILALKWSDFDKTSGIWGTTDTSTAITSEGNITTAGNIETAGYIKTVGNIETTAGDIVIDNGKIEVHDETTERLRIYNDKISHRPAESDYHDFTFPTSGGVFVTDTSIVSVLSDKNVSTKNLDATYLTINNHNTTSWDPSILLHGYTTDNNHSGDTRIHLFPSEDYTTGRLAINWDGFTNTKGIWNSNKMSTIITSTGTIETAGHLKIGTRDVSNPTKIVADELTFTFPQDSGGNFIINKDVSGSQYQKSIRIYTKTLEEMVQVPSSTGTWYSAGETSMFAEPNDGCIIGCYVVPEESEYYEAKITYWDREIDYASTTPTSLVANYEYKLVKTPSSPSQSTKMKIVWVLLGI